LSYDVSKDSGDEARERSMVNEEKRRENEKGMANVREQRANEGDGLVLFNPVRHQLAIKM
jgi:hypothetical protein